MQFLILRYLKLNIYKCGQGKPAPRLIIIETLIFTRYYENGTDCKKTAKE